MKTESITIDDMSFGQLVSLNKQITDKLKNSDITERVTTWEDVLRESGKTEEEIYQGDRSKHGRAEKRLETMVAVLNQDPSFPDYNNSDQLKYEPRFNLSGSWLSYYNYGVWSTGSNVGSRLCFKNLNLLLHAVKYFLNDYKEYMVK